MHLPVYLPEIQYSACNKNWKKEVINEWQSPHAGILDFGQIHWQMHFIFLALAMEAAV